LPIWKITQPVERDPERHAEYINLMADLIVLAFQTDTTRVATLAAGSDEASFPGVVTVGYERHCHTLEHQGNAAKIEDTDPIAREACRQIHAWYTALFAQMVGKAARPCSTIRCFCIRLTWLTEATAGRIILS
jgi:hypothetical protein